MRFYRLQNIQAFVPLAMRNKVLGYLDNSLKFLSYPFRKLTESLTTAAQPATIISAASGDKPVHEAPSPSRFASYSANLGGASIIH